MSRSNNTEITNPAKKFFKWDGDGGFSFYDKEKKENVKVPLPFSFLVLDTFSTIRGWDDAAQSGFWSNEVRNIKNDILTVRNKNGIVKKDIYENLTINGARYCQSVYIAYKEKEGLVIANIQMIGAALGSWIEFRKKNKIFEGAIEVKNMVEGKKGKTIYQIPVFAKIDTTEETNNAAKDLDKELQVYLTAYFAKNNQAISEKHIEETIKNDDPIDTIPEDRENAKVEDTETDLPF